MSKRIDLLLIDPQIDFCDPDKGSLYVPNAENDIARIAHLIDEVGHDITNIHVTLDCHHLFDIAHPQMWKNSEGENPNPFTIISHKDTIDGVWFPIYSKFSYDRNARQYVQNYTKTLEDSGRFPLCIWPPHCLIGSEGNQIMPELFEALMNWEIKTKRNIDFVSKGSNPITEHYSAVKAEVPDPHDPSTQLNTRFMNSIEEADEIWGAGEAGSHCVKNTIEDIANGFSDSEYIKKIILLEDCISPVQSPVIDFFAIQQQFIVNMKSKGMQIAKSTDFIGVTV